ncbi:hypothetical protein LINPERPRIM_LOCUS14995, partial [Linum perenne]
KIDATKPPRRFHQAGDGDANPNDAANLLADSTKAATVAKLLTAIATKLLMAMAVKIRTATAMKLLTATATKLLYFLKPISTCAVQA